MLPNKFKCAIKYKNIIQYISKKIPYILMIRLLDSRSETEAGQFRRMLKSGLSELMGNQQSVRVPLEVDSVGD